MKFAKHGIAICLFCLIACMLCPETGLGMTIKQEEDLSREFMKVIFCNYKLIRDPLIVGYVEKIGKRILSVMPPQPFDYNFYVINEDVYNAFAAPAGQIFINSGLFEAMESEEELAGIISHEISHGICRHISDRIERAKKIGMATLAGVVAGILLGSGGSQAAANAITTGAIAAGQSVSLAYSREDEVQADQIGLKYLTQAGYNGTGLLTVLNKIRNKQWFGSDQIPTYLTTHPAVENRIAYIDAWLQSNMNPKGDIPPNDQREFERAHTRYIALFGEKNAALTRLEAKVRKNPGDPVAHHGYGLILERFGNYKDAVFHLKTALEKRAFDPFILTDLGKIYFSEGRYQEALSALEGALSISPGEPEATFFAGRALLGLGKPEEAASRFEIIMTRPEYTRVLFFLGEAYGKQGKLGDAHYYLGIYYKREGKFKNAVFHLKKAQKEITDPEKQVEIEKMLKGIKQKP